MVMSSNHEDVHVVALVKGRERYVFLFDDAGRTETLRMAGRYAANADLSFTWYDAAVATQQIRRTPILSCFRKTPAT